MKIIKIENSPEEDVAIIMSKKELLQLTDCIGSIPLQPYRDVVRNQESVTVIQPFYDVMSNYLYND